jgi:formylmethanofuran dehydrogenase subunit E
MGRAKEELIVKEDNWNRKAKAEQIHCAVCGSLIEYDDRDTYFDSNMCSSCANTYEKFDEDD